MLFVISVQDVPRLHVWFHGTPTHGPQLPPFVPGCNACTTWSTKPQQKTLKKNIKNMGAATALGVRAILGERNLSNHFKARVSNEGLSTRWFVCRNILKAYYLKPEILHAPRCGRNTRFQNAAHAIERRTTRSAHVSSILRLKMLAFVPFLFDAVWIKSGAKCPSVSEAKRRYGTKRM